jgi:hypothetical protein
VAARGACAAGRAHAAHLCAHRRVVTRAAVLRDPAVTSGIGQFAVIQSVAPAVGVDVIPVTVRDAGEIERAVAAGTSSSGGLVVTSSALTVRHHDLIIALRRGTGCPRSTMNATSPPPAA